MNKIGFRVIMSPFPCGGWEVEDENGRVVRFGAPIGQMPKRFKTPEKAWAAAEKWLRARIKKTEVAP